MEPTVKICIWRRVDAKERDGNSPMMLFKRPDNFWMDTA